MIGINRNERSQSPKYAVWLNKSLDDAEKSTLSGVRNDLISRAEQKKDSVGHLWLEFDETLLEVKGADDVVRLHNTFDADYFLIVLV